MTSQPPDLTTITISTNERHELEAMLPTLVETAKNHRIEVIVVDNGSTDGTSELVSARYPQVKLIRTEQRQGFATNNNRAIQLSSGRYLLLLNPDTRLSADSLPGMIDFMDRHPDAGAAGCKLINYDDGTVQFNCRRFPTLTAVFLRWAGIDRFAPNLNVLRNYLYSDWNHRGVREVDWLIGAFLLVPRSVIDTVGLLDTRFDPLYYEDVDWCYRIKQAKFRIYYNADIEIRHKYHRESAKGVFNRMTYIHMRNLCRFFRKHKGSGKIL